jgi:nitrogen regulatory protein PII
MAKKEKTVITGPMIKIKGNLARHHIVKKVVNTFIKTEYLKKGKGVVFQYPVENLPDNQLLYIVRPGHKKNFDFKVNVVVNHGLGDGTHKEIAENLRKKRKENRQKFKFLLKAVTEIYNSTENDVDITLKKYRGLKNSFQRGGNVESLLKIIKWLFIMEDIVYWDNEGRAFLFNFLRYVAEEKDEKRLKEALDSIRNPDGLRRFMRKCDIDWISCEK